MPGKDDCEVVDLGTIPFYKQDIPAQATIEVPRKTKSCVEKFEFQQCCFNVCGCDVKVCVPCRVYCDETSQCSPVPLTTEVKVRVRTEAHNGAAVADVWVTGVKGLPDPAVIGLQLTADQINQRYKTNVSF